MATPIKKIIDSMIITLQDYKLQKLKQINIEAYESILEGFVLKGKTKFKKCNQSLEYNDVTKEFVSDLTDDEIGILADFGSIIWFTREVQNVLEFNGKLKNREFDHYAESQNLKEKREYLIFLEEKVQQDILEYKIANPKSWKDTLKL